MRGMLAKGDVLVSSFLVGIGTFKPGVFKLPIHEVNQGPGPDFGQSMQPRLGCFFLSSVRLKNFAFFGIIYELIEVESGQQIY